LYYPDFKDIRYKMSPFARGLFFVCYTLGMRENREDPLEVKVGLWAGADDIPAEGWPTVFDKETAQRILSYRPSVEKKIFCMTGEIQTIYVDHQPEQSFADIAPPISFAPAEGSHQSVENAVYAAVLKGEQSRSKAAESAKKTFEEDLEGMAKGEAIEYIGQVFADLGYELKWVE
jgi:hypothetical protein